MNKWFNKIWESKTSANIVKIVAGLAAIITFVTTTLISEETFEKWKKGLESTFSFEKNDSNFIVEGTFYKKRETKDGRLTLEVELPEFTLEEDDRGEIDSIKKAISYKVVELLAKDSLFQKPVVMPVNYSELEEVLNNYFPNKNHTRAIKITLEKKSIIPLKRDKGDLIGYLYLSVLESTDKTHLDTLSYDNINFDRDKMKTFDLQSIVTPFFTNYAETFYKDSLKDDNKVNFYNQFFFLPPAFYLNEDQINFQYVRQPNVNEYQGADRNYELKIPIGPIQKLFINQDGKLNFLLKKQK